MNLDGGDLMVAVVFGPIVVTFVALVLGALTGGRK